MNRYLVRVYADESDGEVPPLVRALHYELCRGPHAGADPACERAAMVMARWRDDGSPLTPDAVRLEALAEETAI
jgi:hypothetical protein